MNTTDLRDELAARTEDVRANAPALAAGVAKRVRAVRRRRTVVGAGAAAALAVVLGLVGWQGVTVGPAPVSPASRPTPSISLGSDGMPYRTVPDTAGDVVKDGLRYRKSVGGDTLVAARIGDRGTSSLELTWTPRTTLVSVAMSCWISATDPMTPTIEVRVLLNGAPSYSRRCDGNVEVPGDLDPGEISPGEPGQGWDALTSGEPATLTIQAVDQSGQLVANPGIRVAGAIYELGPQLVIKDSSGRAVMAVPEVIERDGYAYRLDRVSESGPQGPGPRVATPGGVPFHVTYGSAGTGEGGEGVNSISGLVGDAPQVADGAQAGVPQAARDAGVATLDHDGPEPLTGVRVILVYVLAVRVPDAPDASPTG